MNASLCALGVLLNNHLFKAVDLLSVGKWEDKYVHWGGGHNLSPTFFPEYPKMEGSTEANRVEICILFTQVHEAARKRWRDRAALELL